MPVLFWIRYVLTDSKENLEKLKKLLDFQNIEHLSNGFKYIEYNMAPGQPHIVAAEKHAFMEKLRYTFDDFLSIIKIFILSPYEIKYITDIEKEIEKGEALDKEIRELTDSINHENEKKKKDKPKLDMQATKAGSKTTGEKQVAERESPEKLLQNISILENKLEKAHQKLNTTISQNAQYREKINILRKEKNVIEEIYDKLKKELSQKKQTITNTILKAGTAFIERGNAEEDLKNLQNKAEQQKKEFEEKCDKLNQSIEREKKFKEFLMDKQKEKEKVQQLRQEIAANSEAIKSKTKSNKELDEGYQQSAEKEKMIKSAFEKITKETGIKDCKDLVEVFKSFNEKNSRMDVYSQELKTELEEIDANIERIKSEIAQYNTSGATKDVKKHEIKVNLSQKIVLEEKKKQILKAQYNESVKTMENIKTYLRGLLESINVNKDKIKELDESAATEENLMHYFGVLEDEGIRIVSEYAKLIADVNPCHPSKSTLKRTMLLTSNSRSAICPTSSSTKTPTFSTRSSEIHRTR